MTVENTWDDALSDDDPDTDDSDDSNSPDDDSEEGVLATIDSMIPDDSSLAGLALAFEPRPSTLRPVRPSPLPRVVLAWEEYVDVLTDPHNIGRTMRLFRYVDDGVYVEVGEEGKRRSVLRAKHQAQQRARSVRSRLRKTRMQQVWEVTAEKAGDSSWCVYISYEGLATPEELARRAEVNAQRAERGRQMAADRIAQATD